MNLFVRGVMQAIAESFSLPEPILEIGSYQVKGQENLIDIRSLLPGKQYVGVDFRAGPGVDCVADVEHLPQPDSSFGTVIALSTFEHVRRFWVGFKEVYRVLRPDGVFVVSCPFYFHQHGYPSDYWRFTPEAFELLLDSYPTRILGWHGPARRPLHVWAVGFRSQAILSADQVANYENALGKYAHEPLPWSRRLRYELGRVLCGRRPFGPHLDRNRWHSVVQRDAA
jgi:SAM-dependent methyltransferase